MSDKIGPVTAFDLARLEPVDGDYIELDGPTTRPEVINVLSAMFEGPNSSWAEGVYPVLTVDDRTEIIVDVGHGGYGSACLAIANLDHDDAARHDVAGGIYRALSAATAWRLHWSTDDTSTAASMVGSPGVVCRGGGPAHAGPLRPEA